MVEKSELLRLSPSDFISFSVSENAESISQLSLTNLCSSSVAFKVKTSSHRNFLVSPTHGILPPQGQISLSITCLKSDEAMQKQHKFLIQALRTVQLDFTKINWNDPGIEDHKISAKLVQPRDSTYQESEEFKSFRDSVNVESVQELDRDEMQELEIKKKKLTTRSSELTLAIDRLKAEIQKADHKLRFSQDIEMMISSDKGGNFTLMHLAITFVIGFFIGYLFLG